MSGIIRINHHNKCVHGLIASSVASGSFGTMVLNSPPGELALLLLSDVNGGSQYP